MIVVPRRNCCCSDFRCGLDSGLRDAIRDCYKKEPEWWVQGWGGRVRELLQDKLKVRGVTLSLELDLEGM